MLMNGHEIMVGLQPEGTNDLIKRKSPFSGIEMYLYYTTETGIARLKNGAIEPDRLDEAWDIAIENTKANVRHFSLNGMFGFEDTDFPMVVTNESGVLGAAAILGAEKFLPDGKYVMLPSSIHEVLIMEWTDDMNINELTQMVREVNESEVKEKERLGDRAYAFRIKKER